MSFLVEVAIGCMRGERKMKLIFIRNSNFSNVLIEFPKQKQKQNH